MDKKTFQELWYDDELVEVHKEVDDGWRHGNDVWTVFQYGDDFWQASYRVSGDGEYHGIREMEFDLDKVYPVTTVTKKTEYVTTPKRPPSPTRYVRKFHEVEAIQFPGMMNVEEILDGKTDELDDYLDKMEKFEAWLSVNAPDQVFSYRGDKLLIDDGVPEYGLGTWLIKEPGRKVYPLAPEFFEALYEKA